MSQSNEIKQIDEVLVRQIRTERADDPVYSDGSIEDEFIQRFEKGGDYKTETETNSFKSWAQEYHLSAIRHNLLRWYQFNPEGNVLEVGAGCGALTGLLCSKLKKVTALEYSRKRALVTAKRHSRCSNLEVVIGGLQDFETDQKFDYITVIGVLEYAGVFYGGKDPHVSFLNKLLNMLSDNGELILAIENKIGIKYLCGAPEDHTARIFDSVYDYPYSSKVRTFSRNELAELFHKAGFQHLQWYYPVPDYKMPREILSDEIVPSDLDSIWNWLPARTVGMPRKEVLSEKRLAKTFAKAELFGEVANSFLVTAQKQESKKDSRCLRFIGTNPVRKPEYQTYIEICRKDGKRIVVRKAQSSKAEPFLKKVAEREALADDFINDKAQVIRGRLENTGLCYQYIDHPSLHDLIAERIKAEDPDFGKSLIEDYTNFLCDLPGTTCIPQEFMQEFAIGSKSRPKPLRCIQKALLDCVPHNIKVGREKWYIIDNEWTYDFPVPIDYLVFRGILSLVNSLQPQIQCAVSQDRPVAIFRGYGKTCQYIPVCWLKILQKMEISVDELAYWEEQLQKCVWSSRKSLKIKLKKKIEKIAGKGKLRLKQNPRVFYSVSVNEIKTSPEFLYNIRLILQKFKQRLSRIL